jgi:hypothetical protein
MAMAGANGHWEELKLLCSRTLSRRKNLILSLTASTRLKTFVARINMNYHLGIRQSFQNATFDCITQIVGRLDRPFPGHYKMEVDESYRTGFSAS